MTKIIQSYNKIKTKTPLSTSLLARYRFQTPLLAVGGSIFLITTICPKW